MKSLLGQVSGNTGGQPGPSTFAIVTSRGRTRMIHRPHLGRVNVPTFEGSGGSQGVSFRDDNKDKMSIPLLPCLSKSSDRFLCVVSSLSLTPSSTGRLRTP